ncbi:MAG TPA: sigma-70 family RNA polymerase sigma factor [Kofleriaceae bacterium]|nr:sigma-70 family RNA polymerase sigma factor [Kofleriaceae bacterium]
MLTTITMPLPPPTMAADRPDSARLTAMFATYGVFVWRTLRRLGVPDGAADDGCQEVFIVAARNLKHISVSQERAFLFGVAVRVAATVRRAQRRKPWHAPSADGDIDADIAAPNTDAATQLDQHYARVLLDQIVQSLDEDVRAVFISFELEQMTMSEIAQALDLPAGTVASRLRRAREQFQAAVERHKRGAR